jgi:lysophospholipase L1-like esterase
MKRITLVLGAALVMLCTPFIQAQNSNTEMSPDSIAIKEKKAKEKEAYEKWLKLDWPNLKRFSDANTKLGLPAANENRVVFMGNSITEGWSNKNPEFFEGKPYVNRGISGQTTPQMLVRFRADVINLKPKVVVILAGTNDIAGNTGPSTLEMIEDNIASMAELAWANKIKVVLCSILPAYDYPWKPGLKPYEKILVVNEWIKNYAEKKGFVYLDYYSAMVDARPGLKAEYGSDGVHPNKLGYEVMDPMVEKAIAKALKSK